VSLSMLVLLSFLLLAHGLEPLSPTNMDFSNWDSVVQKLVTVNNTIAGFTLNTFNYPGLSANYEFANFTWQVENAVDLDKLNYDQFLAFWINVYNYLAVRLVFENPCAQDIFGSCRPILSIEEIGTQQPSFVTNIWGRPALHIASLNKTLSLDDIEHRHLREPPNDWIEDTRIHAAIVCASISCPNLRKRAYTVDDIDAELSGNALDFLSNTKKGVNIEGDSLRISAIFSFFPDDFNNKTGPKANKTNSISIAWFLANYGPPYVKEYISKNPTPVFYYFTYDWNLNGPITGLCSVDRLCYPWWAFVVAALGIALLAVLVVVIYRRSRKQSDYQVVN